MDAISFVRLSRAGIAFMALGIGEMFVITGKIIQQL